MASAPPKYFRDPNPFNCIAKMEHQTQVLALGVIGTAAIFGCAIQLSIGIQEQRERAFFEEANGITDGTRQRSDADDESSEEVRFEQGHEDRPEAFIIAGHLAQIHAFCVDEVTMMTSDPKAKKLGNPRRIGGCSAMTSNEYVRTGVLELFMKGEPMPLTPAQQAAEDRMVAKGMLDSMAVVSARKKQALRQGETWRQIHDDVLREYHALAGGIGEAADPGVSGASAETVGEHHFNQLPKLRGLALWDKLTTNLRPAFQRWCTEIVMGTERQYTIEEAESLNEIFTREMQLLRDSRKSFFVENKEELTEAGTVETWNRTEKAPPPASAQPVVPNLKKEFDIKPGTVLDEHGQPLEMKQAETIPE